MREFLWPAFAALFGFASAVAVCEYAVIPSHVYRWKSEAEFLRSKWTRAEAELDAIRRAETVRRADPPRIPPQDLPPLPR